MTRFDIRQELEDLFLKEDLICFFDFHVPAEGGQSLHGLCKIARPKDKGRESTYYSLVFIVDTPKTVTGSFSIAEKVLGGLEQKPLSSCLENISYAFLLPSRISTPYTCIREYEVVLQKAPEVEKSFVEDELVPAVQALTGIQLAEINWWGSEERPQSDSETETADLKGGSLVKRLKHFLLGKP